MALIIGAGAGAGCGVPGGADESARAGTRTGGASVSALSGLRSEGARPEVAS
jgi:hypothetical protein